MNAPVRDRSGAGRPAPVRRRLGGRSDREAPYRPIPVGIVAVLAYLALHVAFAIGDRVDFLIPMSQVQAGLGLVLAGVAALASRRPELTAVAAAYITASEVLWRAQGVGLPWEAAKLALLALMVVGIVRFIPRPVGLLTPVVYCLALVPGSAVTVAALGLVEGIHQFDFAVLAHVALAAGVVFFANLGVTARSMTTILWTLLGPITTLTLTASLDTARLDAADFSATASNLASSGGYGPNQVSAVVAFGALAAILLIVLERRAPLRLLAAVLALGFATQSALTLSRGGLFSVAIVLVALAPLMLRDRRSTARVLGLAAAAVGVTAVLILPALQELTGGAVSERFTSSTTTLRTEIAVEDLQIWTEHPVLGVGVGEAEVERDLDKRTSTHTEYTGLLAEHGMLGLVALGALALMTVGAWRRQVTLEGRVLSIALTVWALATMTHLAVRLALIPFAFALGAATLLLSTAPAEGDVS